MGITLPPFLGLPNGRQEMKRVAREDADETEGAEQRKVQDRLEGLTGQGDTV